MKHKSIIFWEGLGDPHVTPWHPFSENNPTENVRILFLYKMQFDPCRSLEGLIVIFVKLSSNVSTVNSRGMMLPSLSHPTRSHAHVGSSSDAMLGRYVPMPLHCYHGIVYRTPSLLPSDIPKNFSLLHPMAHHNHKTDKTQQ